MNAQRRKEIDGIIKKLKEIQPEIEAISQDEEEARDNMPESLEGGEGNGKMDEAIINLDGATYGINDLVEYLELAQE